MEQQKITSEQRLGYRMAVNFTCEECHRTELELSVKKERVIKLQPHRIHQGADYKPSNVKVVCPDCHGIFSSAQNKARGITA